MERFRVMDGALMLRDLERRDQEALRRLILDGLREHWGTVDETLNPDLDDIAATYATGRTVVAEMFGVRANGSP